MRIEYTLEGANGDQTNSQHVSALHPLPVSGSFSASTSATATASAPSYSECQNAALSMDRSGNLRVSGTFAAAAERTARFLHRNIFSRRPGK